MPQGHFKQFIVCAHIRHMSSKISMFKIWWLFWSSNLGVGYKFLSRGFRKFFSPIFLAKNKSFEQKTPFETKNSGLQWLFEDLSSSRKNPQDQIFTHFRISGEITKEMMLLRISGEITTDNWIFYSTDFRSMCLMCANHTFYKLKRLREYLRDQNF